MIIFEISRFRFPVTKQGKSYRPKAILPYLSKAFERIVHTQIVEYFNDDFLLTSTFSGFRWGYSYVTAIVGVAKELRLNLDRNIVTF